MLHYSFEPKGQSLLDSELQLKLNETKILVHSMSTLKNTRWLHHMLWRVVFSLWERSYDKNLGIFFQPVMNRFFQFEKITRWCVEANNETKFYSIILTSLVIDDEIWSNFNCRNDNFPSIFFKWNKKSWIVFIRIPDWRVNWIETKEFFTWIISICGKKIDFWYSECFTTDRNSISNVICFDCGKKLSTEKI
jgi:hypothetical protein